MLKLVIIGTLVHLLLLYAALDVYFTSPLSSGMMSHKSHGIPPAKRLVLFVADGLRARSLYTPEMKAVAPFLHSIQASKGCWGISHTQVPTESRPGHIAILAGFGEDPSAITKGWKYNPVDFDSVINQSTNAWCWGSPDIVDIFNKDGLPHIHLDSYDAYMQDFSGKESPSLLDLWVFNRVMEVLKDQAENCVEFCQDGNVYFLHLLGLDTAGHSIKPEAKQYIENIKIVDEGVKNIVELFDNFFNDTKTAYIFTSDHGMTNWGSHGDGSGDETEVPFIIWGSGIWASPEQQDLEQIDIAALISSMIGINIPINSMGKVRHHYMHTSMQQRARIMQANALQMLEQFNSKHFTMKNDTAGWFFKPFGGLSEKTARTAPDYFSTLFKMGQFKEIITWSTRLIDNARQGLTYYNRYYQNVILSLLTVGFIGWMVFLAISLTSLDIPSKLRNHKAPSMPISTAITISALVAILVFIFAQLLPYKYSVYYIFPIVIWVIVIAYYKNSEVVVKILSSKPYYKLVFRVLGYLLAIQVLVLCFYEPKCLWFIFMYFTHKAYYRTNPSNGLWATGHCVLGCAAVLMDIQTTFYSMTHILTLSLWLLYGFLNIRGHSNVVLKVLLYQYGALSIAFLNAFYVDLSFKSGYGLLPINQIISWSLLLTSWIPPFMIKPGAIAKLPSIIISLVTPYSLMGIGYENLVLLIFALHMLNWVHHESALAYVNPVLPNHLRTSTSGGSVRRCLYCLVFIMMGYFGTGNTASLNSFDPMWVRCFVTVFSPYTMTTLILIKLVTPFLLVMCAFNRISLITHDHVRNSFLIIFLFCDVMVIEFMWLIKNQGSWLEIGLSLSRFFVASVTTMVLVVLNRVANFLMTYKFDFFQYFNVR